MRVEEPAMTDTPWTPGPWEVETYQGVAWLVWSNTAITEPRPIAKTQADARLIAAAPEMAEMVGMMLTVPGMPDALYRRGNALLARIRGEAE